MIEARVSGSAGILLHVQLHTTQWSRIVTEQSMVEGISGDTQINNLLRAGQPEEFA